MLKQLAIGLAVIGGLGALGVGLAAVTSGLAGSARADTWETTPPTAPFSGTASGVSDNAQTVVNQLTSSNYKVILNKVGSAPLDQCKVTGVTPGQQIVSPVTAGVGGESWVVQFTTVYVKADCTTRATPEPAKSGT